MLVKTLVTKIYQIEMTESQARDLLNLAVKADSLVSAADVGGPNQTEKETLDCLRQALLSAGLTKDPT